LLSNSSFLLFLFPFQDLIHPDQDLIQEILDRLIKEEDTTRIQDPGQIQGRDLEIEVVANDIVLCPETDREEGTEEEEEINPLVQEVAQHLLQLKRNLLIKL
jgi:hypothetical protein